MMKKTLLLGGILAGVLAFAPSAMAANLGHCQLDGLATLTPGLGANQPTPDPEIPGGPEVPQVVDWGPAFTYTFHGDLVDCLNVFAGVPGGLRNGQIVAGETVTIEGTAYDWPTSLGTPRGNGGCTGSHTEGTALVLWGGDDLSVIDYSTDGAAALVGLTGQFGSESITFASKAKNPDGTPVTTRTILADELAGDYTGGPLVFHPEDPTLCTSTGVVQAPITGIIGHGTYE